MICPRCGSFTDEHYLYCVRCNFPLPHPGWNLPSDRTTDTFAWVLIYLLIGGTAVSVIFAAVLYLLVMGI